MSPAHRPNRAGRPEPMQKMPLILCWLLTTPTWVQAAGPSFTVATASSPAANGEIERIDKDWSVTLAGQKAMPGAELIRLRRADISLPPFPAGPHVVFANGDRLAGQVVNIERGEVHFKTAVGRDANPNALQEISIPVSALSIIWFRSPPAESSDELTRRWTGERRR